VSDHQILQQVGERGHGFRGSWLQPFCVLFSFSGYPFDALDGTRACGSPASPADLTAQ